MGDSPDQCSRVNAVETLYAAFPAFLYIDPELGGLLLEPLFRLQASPNRTNPYSAPDLGEFWNRRDRARSTDYQRIELSQRHSK